MAQLVINMDQNQLTKYTLMEEHVYFDGMHKCCQGWKTLTLWLYHPSSCRLYRIATMEVKAEDSANCAEFWKVFNEMLQELCNDENYYFNPIIEEEGGNFIPSKRAKHRPAEQVGDDVQGIEVPLQQTTSTQGGNIQTNQENTEDGNGEDNIRRIDERNEVGRRSTTPRRPLATLNMQNRNNPPLLCFLAGHNIKQCYGCKNKFGNSMQTPPNDIIVKMQVVRDRLLNNTWVPGWKRSWGYFHPNINCLKLEKSILEVEDIYIPTDTRVNMKPVHINKLKAIGWWERVKKRE